MEKKNCFLAVALASVAFGAQANETYLLEGHGYGYYTGAPNYCPEGIAPDCNPNIAWTAIISVELAPNGDGLYSGTDFLDMKIETNFPAFNLDITDFTFGPKWAQGPNATVSQGRLTNLFMDYIASGEIQMPDIQVALQNSGSQIGLNYLVGNGGDATQFDIRGFISAVPESEAWLLLLAGLGIIGIGTARAKSAPRT